MRYITAAMPVIDAIATLVGIAFLVSLTVHVIKDMKTISRRAGA